MRRRFGPSKYQRLTDYLTALVVDEVRLTFSEIEAILGAPLPAAARQASFWSNRPRDLFRGQPWVPAGWRVMQTELRTAQPAVTFARVASGPDPVLASTTRSRPTSPPSVGRR